MLRLWNVAVNYTERVLSSVKQEDEKPFKWRPLPKLQFFYFVFSQYKHNFLLNSFSNLRF